VKLSSLPLALWVPLASGVAIGVPGLVALLTHHLILFASLVTGELLQMLHPAPPPPSVRPSAPPPRPGLKSNPRRLRGLAQTAIQLDPNLTRTHGLRGPWRLPALPQASPTQAHAVL
jgi:hypothetical protein